SLWVIDVPGGRREPIVATRRRYRGPVGRLRIEVVDRGGRPLPARVSVTRPDGRAYAPDDAWRHADEAFDRGEHAFEYGYFHTAGSAELTLPAGAVHIAVWHGPEFRVASADATVRSGGTALRRIVLDRIADLPALGWWSGDLHVHMNYGGAYRNTPEHLADAQGALFGYVHPFDARPDPADTTEPLTDELPVDVALGKVDYIEVMGYSDHLITSEIWYRLLNCGFRLPAGAGTDAFPNFASLRGPPGLVRVFVQAGARLDARAFLAGLKAGRTFVSNAPLLEFTLDGRQIGDEIRL